MPDEEITLLFQGDSITDAGRKRNEPAHLGSGYVNLVAGTLGFRHPKLPLNILNRGISGNRSRDLLDRWEEDCLALRPQWFSLFIGINNTWRRFDQNDPTPPKVFEAELRELVDMTIQCGVHPDCAVLMEPFLLDEPKGSKRDWFEDLIPKQNAVRKISEEFRTRWIPLQAIFNEALERAPAAHWAPDGVHPTPAGHYLIAQAWLNTMEEAIGAD